MENRKLIKFIIPIFILGFFIVNINFAFGYESETHAYLTNEIFNFYNDNFNNNKISDNLKNYLIDGSRREDDPPRWMNHFYDPVKDRGLSYDRAIDPLINVGSWEKAKDWANDENNQNNLIYKVPATIASILSAIEQNQLNLISDKTNFTWQEAVRAWSNGEKEKAMFTLGHILHLVEDISVPDHSRNDPHLDDSPYENFTKQFTLGNSDMNLSKNLSNKQPIALQNLGDYFKNLATYSNNNFYSKDTIGIQSGYDFPQPDYQNAEIYQGYFYIVNKDSSGQNYYLLRKKSLGSLIITNKDDMDIQNNKTMNSYWSLLSVKSVQYGAGIVNLFFQEAEAAKNNPNFSRVEKPSIFAQVLGAVENAASSVKNFISDIGSAARSALVSNSSGLQPIGEITLDNSQNNDSAGADVSQNQNDAPATSANKTATKTSTNINKTASNKTESAKVAELNQQIKDLKQHIINLEKNQDNTPDTNLTDANNADNNPVDNSVSKTESAAKTPIQCVLNGSQLPTHSGLIINEIAWMGSLKSASDEWMELKNISNSDLDVSNWQLTNKNGSIKINLSNSKTKIIKPNQFLLFERTDNNSAKGTADLIYSGALSNSNEELGLFDSNCNLIDIAAANPKWPAGDNTVKKTMERNLNDLGWHTSSNIGGTPKKENSSGIVYGVGGYSGGSSPGGTSSPNNSLSINKPAPQFYPVLINEIMYNPQGSDDGREWIEIFNKSSSTIDLTEWKFSESGSDHGLTLKQGDKNIYPDSYAIISNNTDKFLKDFPGFSGTIFQSSFSLANSGETLILKNQDLQIDEITYSSSTGAYDNGQSLQLIDGSWQEAVPTPGADNILEPDNFTLDDNQGDTATSTPTSTPNAIPQADFKYDLTIIKPGDLITFDASSSTDSDGNIILYNWDFGDGQTASSTAATTTHIYNSSGNYSIVLTVFDDQNASSTFSAELLVISPPRIFISEIVYDGNGDDNGKEFIELYNAGDSQDLSGWSLEYQMQDSTITESLAVFGSQPEDISTISQNGFLLIGLNNYNASNYNDIAADIKRAASLPNGINGENINVILYDQNNNEISRVEYDKNSAPDGESLERKAFKDGVCYDPTEDYEFLGNGCNLSGGQDDFIKRSLPFPQNSSSLKEPRMVPGPAQNFSAQFDKDSMQLILSWQPPLELDGNPDDLFYQINDTNNSSSFIPEIKTKLYEYKIPIKEIGRDYSFSIRAIDKEGLLGEEANIIVSVPGFFSSVNFYQNQESTSSTSTKYYLDLSWNDYPFIPQIFKFSDVDISNMWKSVIFYFNQDAPITDDLLWYDYLNNMYYGGGWGRAMPGALKLTYPSCTLWPTQSTALILPGGCSALAGGTSAIPLNQNLLADKRVSIEILPESFNGAALSGNDYITIGFYAFKPGYEPNNYGMGLVAIDKTKYYFTDIK